jgi:molybdopterin-dependent oxidoreductase alpha subunit
LEFIERSTEGYELFRRQVLDASWEEIERTSGVDHDTLAKIADYYVAAKNVVFGWTMGITQHAHGVANVQSIVNLALLRGMVGRPRAGVMPIRGHSNVQGIGSMGFTPKLKQDVLEKLESSLGVKLPTSPGLDTMGCMRAAERGDVRAALCLGGNLYGSNPDASFAGRALNNLDLVAYLSTSLNTGHVWGRGRETLILPVRTRDEECQKTTQESMFNYVRLSDGGITRHEGPRSEVDVTCALAHAILGDKPVDWSMMNRHENIRHFIARIIPGLAKMAEIDRTKEEFHIDGRILHGGTFPTRSGKAHFTPLALRPLRGTGRQLRLMTVRSEGQFNTVVYEEEDIYRGQDRRDVILMHPEDIERLGLHVNQPATVRSEAGVMRNILVRPYDIRAGNAVMYYPEANVLVPTTTDPDSKTPAFKSVLITVEPESLLEAVTDGRQALALVPV